MNDFLHFPEANGSRKAVEWEVIEKSPCETMATPGGIEASRRDSSGGNKRSETEHLGLRGQQAWLSHWV